MSAGTINKQFMAKRRGKCKNKQREIYLRNIQKTLWNGREIPRLPIEAVTDLATELFSSTCKARKLAGLHLPEAVQVSCKGKVSPCSLILALLYLERLKSGGDIASEYLSEVTPSELFIVSMLVANKFLQDEGDSNEVENWFWSDISGFEVDHINKLEKNFLSAINWEVYVSSSEFWNRLKMLQYCISLRQGYQRGWFKYEELNSLLEILASSAIIKTILMVNIVCLVSYLAAAISLIGSSILIEQAKLYLIPQRALSSPMLSVTNVEMKTF